MEFIKRNINASVQLNFFILCIVFHYCHCGCDHDDIKLDTISQRSPPGLKSTKKLWWVKELSPDLHVAGGLTERQIKQAADGGFKSIISLFDDLKAGDFGGEYLPTAFEASEIANIAGLQYKAVLGEDEEWATVEAVKKLSEAISEMEKPILMHCNRAYTISFTALCHLANMSRHDPLFTPHVNSEKLYKMSELMGHDYSMPETKTVVSEITGEPIVENPPKPNTEPDDWLDYWPAHPVYKNWYTAGQIRKGHLSELQFLGFRSVINMRQGKETDGEPSQEQVTLLNIIDGTATYDTDYNVLRQSHATLKTLVIDPKKDTVYVSPTSEVNYEHRHHEEYGDHIGYNEEIQREHFKDFDLNYFHLPIDSNIKYSPEVFEQYKDKLLEIGKLGPVLVHCASGKRTAFMAVLAAALQHNKDLAWALKRINELGFKVNKKKNKDVYDMYTAWLKSDCDVNEKNSKSKTEL